MSTVDGGRRPDRRSQQSRTHDYGESFEVYAEPRSAEQSNGQRPRDEGYVVTFTNAGHVPGNPHVSMSDGDTRLLYTGDFHTDSRQLVAGSIDRPDADVVTCESTYADVSHDPRERVEHRVRRAVAREGVRRERTGTG